MGRARGSRACMPRAGGSWSRSRAGDIADARCEREGVMRVGYMARYGQRRAARAGGFPVWVRRVREARAHAAFGHGVDGDHWP